MEEQTGRINRAIDYIHTNIARPLTVEEVAGAAAISAYHFSRIFKREVGVTVGQYIRRQRLGLAAHELIHNPRATVSDIAMSLGFSSAQNFTRDFSRHYSISPREFRSKVGDFRSRGQYWCRHEEIWNAYLSVRSGKQQVTPLGDVSVENIPETQYAYLRFFASFGDYERCRTAMNRVVRWGKARGAVTGDKAYLFCHCDQCSLESRVVRMEAAVPVTAETAADGDFGILRLPAMRCARRKYLTSLSNEVYSSADFYIGWFPDSGFRAAGSTVMGSFPLQFPADDDTEIEIEHILPVTPL